MQARIKIDDSKAPAVNNYLNLRPVVAAAMSAAAVPTVLTPSKPGIFASPLVKPPLLPQTPAGALPPCQYGSLCYRTSEKHHSEFSHPHLAPPAPAVNAKPVARAAAAASGSEEDISASSYLAELVGNFEDDVLTDFFDEFGGSVLEKANAETLARVLQWIGANDDDATALLHTGDDALELWHDSQEF